MNRQTLFVRWVSYDTRPHELYQTFSKYGVVEDVYQPRCYFTNQPRGFAYIKFENFRDAQAAVRDSGAIKLNGRYLDIEYAQGGRKTPTEMRNRSILSDRKDDDYYRRKSNVHSPRPTRRSFSPTRRSSRRSEWKRSRSRSRSRTRSRSRNKRELRQRSPSPKKYSKNTSEFRESRKYGSDKHKRYRVNGHMGGLELDPFY